MAGTLTVQNLQGPSTGANANKIIIPSGQTLDASAGFVPPAGAVIQIKQSTLNNGFTTSVVANFASVATGLSVSITPSSTSSKVFVSTSWNHQHVGSTNEGTTWHIARNGSALSPTSYIEYSITSTNWHNTVTAQYLDSPATTSSVTYEVYMGNYSGGNAYMRNWGANVITAWEIAG